MFRSKVSISRVVIGGELPLYTVRGGEDIGEYVRVFTECIIIECIFLYKMHCKSIAL